MTKPILRPPILLLAALLFFGQGCSREDGDHDDGPPVNYARFAITTDPATLDPLRSTSGAGSVDQEVARLSFEPFVDFDVKGRPVPALLSEIPTTGNGGLSADGRTITYHLRATAKWSSGRPVTADDVLFTLQQIQNAEQVPNGYELIDRAYAIDDRPIVLHLRSAWAPAVLTYFSYGTSSDVVVPREPDNEFSDFPKLVDGPFRLVSWNRGQAMWFVGNPVYRRGKPWLDEIEVRVLSQSESVQWLQSHYVDWIPVDGESLRALRGTPDIGFVTVQIPGDLGFLSPVPTYAYHRRLTGFAPSPLLPTWNAFGWRSNGGGAKPAGNASDCPAPEEGYSPPE